MESHTEEKKKRLIELVNKSLKEEIRHLPPAEKRGILLNQIFSLCSVCRHNSCFPPSRSLLAGISCSGMALSRLEEIDLMAQKAASNVDTFLFSFMPVFFFPFYLSLFVSAAHVVKGIGARAFMLVFVGVCAGDTTAGRSLSLIKKQTCDRCER